MRVWLCWQIDGRVVAVYNMGLMDHAVSERTVPVNHGRYHVVRFTRSAQNATLQLDLLSARLKRPTGSFITCMIDHWLRIPLSQDTLYIFMCYVLRMMTDNAI